MFYPGAYDLLSHGLLPRFTIPGMYFILEHRIQSESGWLLRDSHANIVPGYCTLTCQVDTVPYRAQYWGRLHILGTAVSLTAPSVTMEAN